MQVNAFDHVAIPIAQPEAMLRFYAALGFTVPAFADWVASGAKHFAVQFGDQKINMHGPALWQDPAFTLRGHSARPGCGDFCFVWPGTLDALRERLQAAGAVVEVGPSPRLGARNGGQWGTSHYTRDPDGNLLEFMVYEPQA